MDDDTADVGAGGASQLQLTVTGTGGLKNANPWTIQAPYGPVKNISLPYSGPASATNGDTLYNAIASVSNTTPIRISTPSQHNLSEGATVVIDQVGGDPAANGTFKIGNVSRVDVRPVRCRHGQGAGGPERHLHHRRPVELSAPSLRRQRRRPDEGLLPGDG